MPPFYLNISTVKAAELMESKLYIATVFAPFASVR